MTQYLTSDEALQKATGKTWTEWFSLLEKAGASNMTHKDIARWLYEQKLVKNGWWCQSITVGYERHAGHREVGQVGEDNYQTETSRTLEGSKDSTLKRWLKKVAGLETFNSVPLTEQSKINKTEKWRYWRAKLADQSRVNVAICDKGNDKSLLAISHEKILDKATADEWKSYWKTFLSEV